MGRLKVLRDREGSVFLFSFFFFFFFVFFLFCLFLFCFGFFLKGWGRSGTSWGKMNRKVKVLRQIEPGLPNLPSYYTFHFQNTFSLHWVGPLV